MGSVEQSRHAVRRHGRRPALSRQHGERCRPADHARAELVCGIKQVGRVLLDPSGHAGSEKTRPTHNGGSVITYRSTIGWLSIAALCLTFAGARTLAQPAVTAIVGGTLID